MSKPRQSGSRAQAVMHDWSNPMKQRLRDLWAEGHSAAVIARAMSIEFWTDLSRNSIVGKAHRIGLDARPSPIKRGGEPAKPRLAAPSLPALASVSATPARDTRVEIADQLRAGQSIAVVAVTNGMSREAVALVRDDAGIPRHLSLRRPDAVAADLMARPIPPSRTCCWPIGDVKARDFRFCDDVPVPGKSYCDGHCQIAYVRIKDHKEAAA